MLHIGLMLLLIIPQPSAGACLMWTFANTIFENTQGPLSEEHEGKHATETFVVRSDRRVCLRPRQVASSTHCECKSHLNAQPRTVALIYAGQRQDQCGAGIRTLC